MRFRTSNQPPTSLHIHIANKEELCKSGILQTSKPHLALPRQEINPHMSEFVLSFSLFVCILTLFVFVRMEVTIRSSEVMN